MAGAKRVCQARELEEGKNNGGRQRNIYLMTLYELNSGRVSLSKRGKKTAKCYNGKVVLESHDNP